MMWEKVLKLIKYISASDVYFPFCALTPLDVDRKDTMPVKTCCRKSKSSQASLK